MNLKKLGIFFFAVLLSCAVKAQLPVTVTGLLQNKRGQVKLFKVVEGKTLEIANSVPGNEGKFGFLFYPEYEGLYVIGTGNDSNPNDNYKFYFKGGERLNLTITPNAYQLNGAQNSKENIILSQWQNLVNPIVQKAINFMRVNSTFKDYFPQQEEIVEKSKSFLTGKKTGNLKFDLLMKAVIKLDLANFATSYLNSPRTVHPKLEELGAYYKTINSEDFTRNTAMIYNYPWGSRTMAGIIMTNLRQRGIVFKKGLEGLKDQLDMIPNDTLKGDLILETAARYKSFNEYKALKDEFGQYIITSRQQKRDMEIMTPLAELKPGSVAFNFSYPDKDGKNISMSDLKGKVVLIDVWATWCGPCKAEIPHLKKLEKEMKGSDLQIVSLSTDHPNDKDKWLKMIIDENLGGIQLFAGAGNDFSKYYRVNTIPRFLVFDKQGKIVNVDAPRPSDSALKLLLEKYL